MSNEIIGIGNKQLTIITTFTPLLLLNICSICIEIHICIEYIVVIFKTFILKNTNRENKLLFWYTYSRAPAEVLQ